MLHGRDPERARIDALLDDARRRRSGVLVVRGEPGVGKTALLDDARERAGDDVTILTARGVESESELPFAALHGLLRPALDRLDRLPEPQAEALRTALGLSPGHADERFLVFAAALTLLADLAEEQPVLCVVDDAHWLDKASADALRFVARRLEAEGVALLFGARDGDVRRFEAEDLPTIVLGGLGRDAASALLAASPAIVPAVRDQLVEHTGGNALALLELPAALSADQLAGRAPLPEALPVTREMERVFLERVRRLPEAAQALLLIAAADDTELLATLARAAEALGVPLDALGEAERARLVTVARPRVEFRHPLVRSAVYGAATSIERAAAHRALAEALAGTEDADDRRAWHLAAAAVEPDEEVVAALERAADRARDRSGYPAEARALERAAELTADPAARGRRMIAAARAGSLAGRTSHAAALAERALELVDDPLLRAEAIRVRGVDEIAHGRAHEGQRTLLRAAQEVAPYGPEKALELFAEAAQAAREVANVDVMIEITQGAAALEPELRDSDSFPVLRILVGFGHVLQGDTRTGAPYIEESMAWGARHDDPREILIASSGATWLGDFDRAAALVGRAADLARASGAMGILTAALSLRSPQLHLAQRFDEAVISATEAVRLAEDLGLRNHVPLPLTVLANVAAVRGDAEEARRFSRAAVEGSAGTGMSTPPAAAIYAEAMLDLGAGRWDDALEKLLRVAGIRPGFSSLLLALMTSPDRIEAAVRAGDAESARAALAFFATWADQSRAPWAAPLVAACRAVVETGDAATELYEEAVALEAAARPFDRARIRLLYGEHLRRERRRVDARVQLRAAIDELDRLGAVPFAERARAELRASGETARKRDPSTLGQLTPQELQVAQLVARGLSNKEVAAQLFLSPRTVDAHLRGVFAKLDVTSRTQLALIPGLAGEAAAEAAPA